MTVVMMTSGFKQRNFNENNSNSTQQVLEVLSLACQRRWVQHTWIFKKDAGGEGGGGSFDVDFSSFPSSQTTAGSDMSPLTFRPGHLSLPIQLCKLLHVHSPAALQVSIGMESWHAIHQAEWMSSSPVRLHSVTVHLK